jgi:hypothetical protein
MQTESHIKLILAAIHFLEDNAQTKHGQDEHGNNCIGGSSEETVVANP